MNKSKKLEHQGIRLEFIGQIGKNDRETIGTEISGLICIEFYLELLNDRSTVHEFINLSKLLAFPGELPEITSLDFNFPNVEKPYESYMGINVKLR